MALSEKRRARSAAAAAAEPAVEPAHAPSGAGEAACAAIAPDRHPDAQLDAQPDALAPRRAAGLDVAGRLMLLREAFERTSGAGADPRRQALSGWLARVAAVLRGEQSRMLKALLGLLVIAAVGWMPVRALLQTTSTEAVVNARLITLRAPIEGEVGPGLARLAVGTQLAPGTTLINIVNQRAERGRLDDLRRLIERLKGEQAALAAQRADLTVLHAELTAQTQAFKAAREAQLAARAAELRSEIAAAGANRAEARRALDRATALAASGTMTKAALDKVQRDAAVAAETEQALRHRLAGVEVERAALARGIFVGDSYNDQPRSSQRADEIVQRLSELAAGIAEREARLASLAGEVAAEQRRYQALAAAELVAPVQGSVWEVMTAPGETVVRGQDLMRLLDCSGLVVTATVGEAAYNRLSIGDPARFRLRGETTEHKGRIIGLTGVATAPANLAIRPAALSKEPYRVTVALPGLATATAGQCDIGRTGRVTFDK
jgi:multidrug resistance efflux pump